MKTRGILRCTGPALGTLLALGLASCVGAPAPKQPSPLELACMNAVAAQSGIPSNRIVPGSTRPVDSATVLIQVDAGGKKGGCLVDKNGTVKSVQPPA